jgi:membrane protein DedA with SNARE-associated domain
MNEEKETQTSWLKDWYITIIGGVIFIGIAVAAVIFRHELQDFRSFGYLGAFVISLMASSIIIVYVPGVPVVFALGGAMGPSLWNPLFVGLAAGLGEGIGELTGYLIGRGRHNAIKYKNNKYYLKAERWMRKRGFLTIFAASSVINPVFDFFGISAGLMGYPSRRFFLACWAGKTVKNIAIAYIGWAGLSYILGWLGIHL